MQQKKLQMNVKKIKLASVLLIPFLYFYLSGLAVANEYIFNISFVFLIGYLAICLLKYKDVVNPLSILFPFIMGFFYYQFEISSYQSNLDVLTVISVVTFIICYILGCMVGYKKKAFRNTEKGKGLYFSYVLFGSGILVFIIESIMTGGFPFVIQLLYKVDIYAALKHVPILHYLVMLICLMPAIFYYHYRQGCISKKFFFFVVIISIFILLNTLSRQIMIFGLIAMFFVYAKVNCISTNKILVKSLSFVLVVFFVVGYIRILSINSAVSQLEYLKDYSGVSAMRDVNTFDVTFNLYSTQNFSTLDDIILNIQNYGFGIYSLKPLIELLHLDNALDFQYPPEFDSFRRLGTIVAEPFLDFGLVGVAFFGALYGFFVSTSYHYYRNSPSIGSSLLWSTAVFVIVMSVFTNFFNVLFVWLCIFIAFIYVKGVKLGIRR